MDLVIIPHTALSNQLGKTTRSLLQQCLNIREISVPNYRAGRQDIVRGKTI